jgi:hypothetical protein
MEHVLDINVPRSRQFRVELALDRDLPPPGRRPAGAALSRVSQR